MPTLPHLLVRAATAHPHRPAVSSSTAELTYGDLLDGSLRLARALVDHGIEPGDRVVIVLAKDVALPIAIFGTLLAGGAYVPIDYLTPPARARAIAADAEPVAVIASTRTMRALRSGVPDLARHGRADNAPALHWVGRGGIDPETAAVREPVTVRFAQLELIDPLRSPIGVPPSAMAYILYTSGSTGRPKGVAHTHASALSFVTWAAHKVSLDENDVLSQHASPSFDLSVFDFFGSALAGARLALVPDATFGRVASLCRLIVSAGVTVWYSVPSALLRASTAAALAPLRGSALRQVIFAGEEIPVGLLGALWNSLPPACRVANWYGPTETNVCTFHDVTARDLHGGDAIPIGRPCPYATTFIIPRRGAGTSNGSTGELLVASDTLMTGYWRLPAATAQVFTTAPNGRVYYATGDVVARHDTGTLTFCGRVDRLLKVRGYRVQPEEVEHVLEQRAEIAEVAVVKYPKGGCDVLAAVVRLTVGSRLARDAITDHCLRLLPWYMVPDIVVPVSELPRGARGKVDHGAVLELVEAHGDDRGRVER